MHFSKVVLHCLYVVSYSVQALITVNLLWLDCCWFSFSCSTLSSFSNNSRNSSLLSPIAAIKLSTRGYFLFDILFTASLGAKTCHATKTPVTIMEAIHVCCYFWISIFDKFCYNTNWYLFRIHWWTHYYKNYKKFKYFIFLKMNNFL